MEEKGGLHTVYGRRGVPGAGTRGSLLVQRAGGVAHVVRLAEDGDILEEDAVADCSHADTAVRYRRRYHLREVDRI